MVCATRAAAPAPATRAREATARPTPSAVAKAPRPASRRTSTARVASRRARGGVVERATETRGAARASRDAHARGDVRDAFAEGAPFPREGGEGGEGGDGGDGGGDDGNDDDGFDDDDERDARAPRGNVPVWVFSAVAPLAAPSEGEARGDARDDDDDADDAGARDSKDHQTRTEEKKTVSVVIPALNEAATIARVLSRVFTMEPKAHEVIVCVGDSEDDTETIVRATFPEAKLVRSERGRSSQMNAGAAVASGDVLFFLHADTHVPSDVVSVIRDTLRRDVRIVCGGFVSLIETDSKTYWGMSLHNVLKTFYAPLLVKPLAFARGLRCLFGDQAMFADATCFRSVRGFDERLPIMEDADLCVRLHESGWVRGSNGAARATPALTSHGKWALRDASELSASPNEETSRLEEGDAKKKKNRFRKTSVRPAAAGSDRGRIVLVNRAVTTSGRRIEGLGNFKATLTHFLIGVSWCCGADPDAMVALYRKFYPPANP